MRHLAPGPPAKPQKISSAGSNCATLRCMADPALDSLFASAGSLTPVGLEFVYAGFVFMSSVFPNSQGGLLFSGQVPPQTLSGQLYPDSEEGTSTAQPVGTVTITAPMLVPTGLHGGGGPHWTDYSLSVTVGTSKQVLTPQAAGPLNGIYFLFGTWGTPPPGSPEGTWPDWLFMVIGTPLLANKLPNQP